MMGSDFWNALYIYIEMPKLEELHTHEFKEKCNTSYCNVLSRLFDERPRMTNEKKRYIIIRRIRRSERSHQIVLIWFTDRQTDRQRVHIC